MIGNNVFIGMNTLILRNVKIGDNVIIGASSVVTQNCESGTVYAGNPAKPIMKIEDYIYKRKSLQLEEAKKLAQKYKERMGEIPPKSIFFEYFQLFESAESACKESKFFEQMHLCKNYEETQRYMDSYDREFQTFDDFLDFCLKE